METATPPKAVVVGAVSADEDRVGLAHAANATATAIAALTDADLSCATSKP